MGSNEMKKYILIGIGLLGALLLLLLLSALHKSAIENKGTSQQIMPTPTKAPVEKKPRDLEVYSETEGTQILFNNQVYFTPAIIKNVPLGSYALVSHKPGYKDGTTTVVVDGLQTVRVLLKLEPLPSDSAINDTEGEWRDYFNTQGDTEKKAIETREAKYPFTKYLPEVIDSVMLDYDVNKDGSVQYVVRALPGKSYARSDYEDKINNFINSKGVPPDTLNVIWR